MSHPIVRALALVGLILVPAGGPVAANDRPVYTRAEVLRAMVGEVVLRAAYVRALTVPGVACDGEPFSCVEDRVYSQVYELAFVEETSTRIDAGVARVDRVDRGRLWIGVALEVDDEQAFEASLRGHLAGLGVAAFRKPRAGVAYLRGPIEQAMLRRSNLPAWVCADDGGAWHFDVLVPGDAGERTFARSGTTAERACREFARAASDAPGETFRTLPEVRDQVRRAVSVAQASTLDGLTWADPLPPLPEGVTFTKKETGERKTGAIRDRRDGTFRGHEGRYGEVERSVSLPEAEVRLLEAPMWAADWTIETTRETFGTEPRVEHDPDRSVIVAVVPVGDPLMDEVVRARTSIEVPASRWIDHVVERLRSSSDLDPGVVEDAMADPEAWPDAGDWLVVTCEDDGTARYGIAPFVRAAPVTNPREACAAIRRELPQR